MKKIFILLVLFFARMLHGQNVGIGTTTPSSPLQVIGEVRMDSLKIGSTGDSVNLLDIASGMQVKLDQQSEIPGSSLINTFYAWQSVLPAYTGILTRIDLHKAGSSTSDIRIYEGEGINGTLLDSFSYTFSAGWNQITGLEIPVTPGQKITIYLHNGIHWSQSNQDYSPGTAYVYTSNLPYDFCFKTYVNTEVGFNMKSNGNVGIGTPASSAELTINGKVKANRLQLHGGAMNGYILTSDANGNARWAAPAPANPWQLIGSTNYTGFPVGINAYPATANLEVNGSTKLNGTFRVTTTILNWDCFSVGEWGHFGVDAVNVTRGRFSILENGNVGIGNPNPIFKLQVTAGAPYQNIAMFQSQGGWGQILVSNGTVNSDLGAGEGSGYAGTNSNHDFALRSAAVGRIFLKENGNVGIHQSNPAYKFQISGTTRMDVMPGDKALSIGSNGDFEIESNSGTGIRLKVLENGHVGIGVPSPAYRMHVQDAISSEIAMFQSGATTGSMYIGTFSSFTHIGASNDGYSFIGTSQPNDFTIRTQDTSRIFIKNSTGHVGIGVNTPNHRLHVYQNAPDQVVGLFQGNGGNAQLQVSNQTNTTTTIGAKDAYGWIGTKTIKPFAICTNDSPRIYFGGTGGVGIGNTTPSYALQVTTNPGGVNPIASFESTGTSGKLFVSTPTARLVMGATDNTTYLGSVIGQRVSIMTNSVERFHILADGNVGIGTTDAPKPLTIRASQVEDLLQYTTNSGVAKWHWWMPGGNLVLTESNVADYRLTIEQGGHVGIGMSNPTELLEVNGNLRVNGTLKLSANNSIEVESPIVAVYQNGWIDYDPAYGSVQYYKDRQKRVYLSGVAEHGLFSGTSVVFTLPSGYRPPKDLLIDLPSDDTTSHAARMTVVASTGEVKVTTFNGAFITWVSFENISFRVN